jgi:hypothetical protein
MKSFILAAAALTALTGFAFAESTETNRCHDPMLTLNYQGDCVPRLNDTDGTALLKQIKPGKSYSGDQSDGDSSYPTSAKGSL